MRDATCVCIKGYFAMCTAAFDLTWQLDNRSDAQCVSRLSPTVGITFQETVMLKGVPLRFSPWSVKSKG